MRPTSMLLPLLLLLGMGTVDADVYMHNPRGSNDRNCEKNVNRNNGNRLFDSQNNAKGGYACPRPRVGPATIVDTMYHYAGSKLAVEWTNQHGCGTNPKTHCEIVIQYACEDTLDPSQKYRDREYVGAPRDGLPANANDAATDRIPNTEAAATANTAATRRFGMHENNEFYNKCKARSRNRGLYTADQQVNKNGAIGTRQNPNGGRRGLECPEERDYYPYWAPNPWRDVAVITSSPDRCAYYQRESQNKVARGECMAASDFFEKDHVYTTKCRRAVSETLTADKRRAQGTWYNSKQSCEAVGHKFIPTWFDLRHPDTAKEIAALKASTPAATLGLMNYEVWDGLTVDHTCNTAANKKLEEAKDDQVVPLTAASFDAVTAEAGGVAFEKDGVIVKKGKNTIVTKKSFAAPAKITFTFKQVGPTSGPIRFFVFPPKGAISSSSELNQFTFNGEYRANTKAYTPETTKGSGFPYVRTISSRRRYWEKITASNTGGIDPGCFFKNPKCTKNNKYTKPDFVRDGDGAARTDPAKCEARAAAWNSYCKGNATAETKFLPEPKWATEEQTITIEALPNKTARFWLNGKKLWEGGFAFNGGKLGMGMGSVDAKLTGLSVTDAGIYGLSTDACATKLREAVTGTTKVAHSFSSAFSGGAQVCGASESARPCSNKALCPEAKLATSRAEKLSGYFVPKANGNFKFSAIGAYGTEVWVNGKRVGVNDDKNGATTDGASVQLKANSKNRLEAFSASVVDTKPGCYVKVPGGCTKQGANYVRSYGDPEEFSRDFYGEARGGFYSRSKCLARKAAFDGWCGVTTSEMVYNSPWDKSGTLQLLVNGEPLSTISEGYKLCANQQCVDPAAKQTVATAECKCDDWATRAPKEWGLKGGNACMRPIYDRKSGPWCYCKGQAGKFALCDPKLGPNKGLLAVEETGADSQVVGEEFWTEAADTQRRLLATTSVEMPDVDCVGGKNSMSRENQLGNARDTANPDPAIPHGVNANRYIWTIPNHISDNCVLRLRYNISTSDYPDWDNLGKPLTTAKQNAIKARRRSTKYLGPDGKQSTSPIQQDPYVGFGKDPDKTFLSLAVNTNQYGRTFQDRSYVFHIKPRPEGIPAAAKIYNLNVRGKRGNIVQTYPAVEYDFVPNDLCLNKDDYVHFQWTGSDYNPQRNPNDAEGAGDSMDPNQASRADRSNLIELDTMSGTITAPSSDKEPRSIGQNGAGRRTGEVAGGMMYPAGALSNWDNLGDKYTGMFWTPGAKAPDEAAIMKLAFIDQVERLKGLRQRCKTLDELEAVQNQNARERDPNNCAKLNGARQPYFDGGLMQLRKPGKFAYYSSRNNNFSNRNQAGFMCVGQGTCNSGKGCQSMVEDELLAKMSAESGGTKLIEHQQEEKESCDQKCVEQLRATVQSQATKIAALEANKQI